MYFPNNYDISSLIFHLKWWEGSSMLWMVCHCCKFVYFHHAVLSNRIKLSILCSHSIHKMFCYKTHTCEFKMLQWKEYCTQFIIPYSVLPLVDSISGLYIHCGFWHSPHVIRWVAQASWMRSTSQSHFYLIIKCVRNIIFCQLSLLLGCGIIGFHPSSAPIGKVELVVANISCTWLEAPFAAEHLTYA